MRNEGDDLLLSIEETINIGKKSETSVEFIAPNKPLNILKSILPEKKAEVKVFYNKTNAIFSFLNFTLRFTFEFFLLILSFL